ncbi:MAG: RNA 2',3'-cyclic phosphodiesterase [Candidatus Lokiarchaeota archaeon]
MIRTFIAFDLEDQNTINNIKELTDRLKKNQDRLKIVKPENLHITVKFLGDIKESKAPKIFEILNSEINEKVLGNKVYNYTLKGVGQFRSYSILWIGFEGDIDFLQEIKETLEVKLNERLNIKKDKRRKFDPHLTIGRLRKNRINYKNFDTFKNIIKDNQNTEFGKFKISEIKLKKSVLTPQGPIYSNLKY